MNDRDRNFAIAGGSVVLLIVIYYSVSTWVGALNSLDLEIAKAQKSVSAQQALIDRGEVALAKLEALKERSLPGNRDVARTAYQTWLLAQAQKVGIADINVNPGSDPEQAGLYKNYSYTLAGRGNIRQLTELLHRFYSIDLLHRIKRLSVKPISNSKDLDLVLSIEALLLFGAPETPAIVERPSERLKHRDMQPYLEAIVGRNIFAPANLPPRLSSIGSQKAVRGDSVSFTAKATDADPLDTLRYSLDPGAPEGATIDPKSGKFAFRPGEVGTYSVVVRATDDGLPPLSAHEQVTITVSNPPPPPMVVARPPTPPPPPQPKLDLGKYAYVTALTEIAGKPELWLSIRSSGELLRLYEGDDFEIGALKGKIRQITDREVILVTAGRTFRVKLGDNLSQAEEVNGGL